MSFGNIIGQLLQQGMAGQTQTRGRLQHAANQSGGGMEQMLGSLLGGGGASGARGSGGGLGDLAGLAQQFLGGKQVGGMTGAQAGGLGALVGAVLGGGGGAVKGAVGGGAMAILGTLALTALKNYQAGAAGAAAAAPMGDVAPEEVQAVTDPATERLVLRAMISAAKADGQIDQQEMQAIAGHIGGDGVTDAERQFVIDEMTRPLDLHALAAEVKSPAVAAEVYAASILAIAIDTEAERQYLRDLARAMGLDAGTVQRLHQMTGAPAV
jgi:uncharacterized membrane protein YebE (DUF533 family)